MFFRNSRNIPCETELHISKFKRKRHFIKSTYFTLFFIDFNPDPVDSRLWQCWLCHMPCLHVIVEFFRFGNPLQWRHSAWLFLVIFYFRQLFLVRDRFRCTTYPETLCKWAGACRNRLRTPESQHAWYSLMLGQRWLRWLGNDSTINNGKPPRVLWWGAGWVSTFPIIASVIFFYCFVLVRY